MNSELHIVPFRKKDDENLSNLLAIKLLKHMDPFIKYMQFNRAFSANSVKAYKADVSTFMEYLTYVNADRVGHKQIELFVVYLQEERGNAPSTVNRRLDSLRLFYKYLYHRNVVTENPMDKIEDLKLGERLPVYLTSKEVSQLIDSIPKNTLVGYRDYALIMTFLKTGLRVNEVISLKINNIDFYNRSFKVMVKGGRERIVRFSKELKIVLENYLSHCRGNATANSPLFANLSGSALSRQSVHRIVKYHVSKSGIEKPVSTHTLRHSFATDLVKRGAGLLFVKEALNHKNVSTTQIYTHLSNLDYNKMYDELVA